MSEAGRANGGMTGPSFEFATAARVVFGAGRARELPAMVVGWGSGPWCSPARNPAGTES